MRTKNKLWVYLMSAIICGLFNSCSNDKLPSEPLYFIGDSLIARWDLQESFPSFMTNNDGQSGAKIDLIEKSSGKYQRKTVVVMIGTNDIAALKPESLDAYCGKYTTSILSLGAKHIYLYSILPRNFKNDPQNVNETIEVLNSFIKQRLGAMTNVTYIDIYDAFTYDGTLNMEYSLDGLHLNIYGYEILTKALFNEFSPSYQ